MFGSSKLPDTFVGAASDVLADTQSGLSGGKIVELTRRYAYEYGVDLPHSVYPFDAPNKRTALFENLREFSGEEQYRIIRELCDHRSFGTTGSADREQLKRQLVSRFSEEFGAETQSELEAAFIQETKHWLDDYPRSKSAFEDAAKKLEHRLNDRNMLDDLRLSLELLLKEIFQNEKSLENQQANIGQATKIAGGSSEFANMFKKLLDYYAKYQNNYVKHDDKVNQFEVEFVFEVSAAFMRQMVRIARDQSE